jgi:hypothetical protein
MVGGSPSRDWRKFLSPRQRVRKTVLAGDGFIFNVFEHCSWSEVPHRGTGANSSRPNREYEKPSLPGTVLFLTLTCNKVVPVEGGLNFQAKQKDIQVQK